MNKTKASLILMCSLSLTACATKMQGASTIAASSVENLGCKASQSEMWNSLHKIAEDGGAYPSASELRAALIEGGLKKDLKGSAYEKYVDAFVATYSIAIEGIKEKLAPTDLEGWKKALAELEVGVKVTSVHVELQNKLQPALQDLAASEEALKQTCSAPEPVSATIPTEVSGDDSKESSGTIWQELLATQNPEVYGARKALATAYQSCDVLRLPAMTTASPSVDGITITGMHPGGVGYKRMYGSLAKINASHYYVANNKPAKSSCFAVRTAPMIYDFGGKPYTSASNTKMLDFFKNGGSGTSVLGIDCSAFVFSSLAVAGLKMDPDPKKILKADLVHGIGSGAFKEPQSNGLRCLDKIKVTATVSLLPGDIAAINGHVVLIDYVGADPFGLNKIAKVADCTAANLPYSDFDFVLAQSASTKSGIGINRFQARDYFKETTTFRDGLTRYAVAACKARFGVSSTVDTASLSVVRHKKTKECKAEALVLNKQECVDSCQSQSM